MDSGARDASIVRELSSLLVVDDEHRPERPVLLAVDQQRDEVLDSGWPENSPLRLARSKSGTLIPLTGVSDLTVAAYEDEIELRKSARRPSHLIGCVVDAVTELDNAVDDLMN